MLSSIPATSWKVILFPLSFCIRARDFPKDIARLFAPWRFLANHSSSTPTAITGTTVTSAVIQND